MPIKINGCKNEQIKKADIIDICFFYFKTALRFLNHY